MKQRLLIVDDEPGIVDMMASYFSSQYEVLTAYCGNEALQKLARQPDLILLDINMPDIDGLTLCQKIRELITCPILFLTARVESADKIIGFHAVKLPSAFALFEWFPTILREPLSASDTLSEATAPVKLPT